jgi:hypothetical protein
MLIGLWVVADVVQIGVRIHGLTYLFFSLQLVFLDFPFLDFDGFKSGDIQNFSHDSHSWSQLGL